MYPFMTKDRCLTCRLESLNALSSLFRPGHMRTDYCTSDAVKQQMLFSSTNVLWNVF